MTDPLHSDQATDLSLSSDDGRNLIFLISLPRSGSTLVQHVLASHSQIASSAEPWLLFPVVVALKPGTLSASYHAETARIALSDFVDRLPGGRDDYYRAVRRYAEALYEGALAQSGKTIFLDKTSRYYQAVPEIWRIFPNARYVFLLRNPLGVLSSYLDVMIEGNLRRLGEDGIREDLLHGYHRMRSAIRFFGDDAVVMRYEDVVRTPQMAFQRLCRDIAIPFEPTMLNYGSNRLPGRLVDPKSIHQHNTVVPDYVEAWRTRFHTLQLRALGHDYLDYLGDDLLSFFGYDRAKLGHALGPRSSVADSGWKILTKPPSKRSLAERARTELSQARLVGPQHALRSAGQKGLARARKALSRTLGRIPPSSRADRAADGLRRILGRRPGHSSDDYALSSRAELRQLPPSGWSEPSVARRQAEAYRNLLADMRAGRPRRDFQAAAQALKKTKLSEPSFLEIGCGNGYYLEVLNHLCKADLDYTGLDASAAMIDSARAAYPSARFLVGEATALPFDSKAFDIVWSGTVLMHMVEYEKAIAEACRVSRQFAIFHSTPLLSSGKTTFLTKRAYGGKVAEVIINQREFEELVRAEGFRLVAVVESLPYHPPIAGSVDTLTHVFGRL